MEHIELKLYEPDEPEMSTTVAGYVSGSDSVKESNVALFEIRSMVSKGKGLVARFDIPKAHVYFTRSPFSPPRNRHQSA
jgi:hypothetical protein